MIGAVPTPVAAVPLPSSAVPLRRWKFSSVAAIPLPSPQSPSGAASSLPGAAGDVSATGCFVVVGSARVIQIVL
ncbi:unnamed protein product [Linum trigynum]|uniref:Uncharacterized protein n=1 Tax=Linum trigynum TaxID=586398 RepID=A0AAV2DT02_9ROSI